MAFFKRYSILWGLVIVAGVYLLLVASGILQSPESLSRALYRQLNNLLIGITKPVALSTISIFAYFVGLLIRRNKVEFWSDRVIWICALVAAVPAFLLFFMNSPANSNNQFPEASSYFSQPDDSAISAAPSQPAFDSLLSRAQAGDLNSILTVAHLYCLGCDTAVKLDLRNRNPLLIAGNKDTEALSSYAIPAEDIKEAFKWYEVAARMGSLKARNVLGEMLAHGVGVLQDKRRAFQLFKEAAMQGYVPAQFNLAAMYEYGYGVEKDILQAHVWYNIIAAGAKDHADEDALYARTLRSALEAKMGKSTVAQASEKARVCLESKFQKCH